MSKTDKYKYVPFGAQYS